MTDAIGAKQLENVLTKGQTKGVLVSPYSKAENEALRMDVLRCAVPELPRRILDIS